MKKFNFFNFVLFLVVLPFVPIYFIYKSQTLSKKTKIISITSYIAILIVVGMFNEDSDFRKSIAAEPEKTEDIANNDNSEKVAISNDVTKQDDSTISNDVDEVEDQQTEKQPDYDINYTDTVTKWSYDFSEHFSNLSDLLVNNDVESAAWNKKIVEVSNKLINDCSVVLNFEPPSDFTDINNNLISACTNYMYGVTDLLDGLRTLDEDKLSNVEIFFMLGNEHINIATELLSNKQ